jgi:outer membrane protein OmpA-like peptidoglycan-associated protein
MRKIFFIILFLIPAVTFAQKSIGDKYYSRLEYAEAIKFYQKDFEKTGNSESLALLAECYFKTHQYEKALDHYIQFEKSGILNTQQLYNIASLYFENDQPEKGKQYMLKYSAASGSTWWNDMFEKSLSKTENNDYLIYNLDLINTSYSEFSPQKINGEILFTSDRPLNFTHQQTYGGTMTPFLNLFITNGFKNSDSLIKIKNLWYNSDFTSHAGPGVFDSLNNRLFFSFVNDKNKNIVNKSELVFVYKEGKKWSKPEKLSFIENTSSYAHPCWIPEKQWLVFSSDKPDGKGGKDLYYSKWNETSWSTPQLIPYINTPGDEEFPSLRKKENGELFLYFSSNGFPGKGGLDFYSLKISETFDSTIIWNSNISSPHDDFGITFENDSRGFFSSNRNGGKGGDDIYFFIENPNAVQICLTCFKDGNSCAGKAIDVKKDNQTLETVYTDENGCAFIKKLPDGANALQLMDNTSDELKIKSVTSGVNNKNKLVVLDRSGITLMEITNEDGKLITESVVRTVWLTDHVHKGPAKGIRIEVRSVNGEVTETIITDENGKAVIKKIPPGEKFLLAIDADEIHLDPALKKDSKYGIILLDQFGKKTDSLSAQTGDIRIEVLKIKTVNLCFYNQIKGEPLAHYRVTLRADDGTPIDTAITDANGCYKFKKLPTGDMLLTVDNYDGGAIKVKVSGMEESGIKNLIIQNSKGMVIESMNADGTKLSKTFCVFDKSSGKPVVNTLVHLANEKLQIIDSVFTGTDGCFTYKKLNDDGKNLNLLTVADEAELFIKGKENKSNEKMQFAVYSNAAILLDSVTSSSSDYSLGILQKMILSGCLTSKTDGKPLAFTKVYFKDAQGNKMDSTLTDKNGCFDYKRLGNLPAQLQVMTVGDTPFQFSLNEKSQLPNRLVLRDQFENLLGSVDPVFKKHAIPSSRIHFYDQADNHPLSGMEMKIVSDGNTEYLVSNEKGEISYDFISGKNYQIIVPAGKINVKTPTTSNGYQIDFKSEKNSVKSTFAPGNEINVHISNADYVTAMFKNPQGIPVADLPVEWYDERTGKWNISLTDENGNSKHIYDKQPDEVKIRVSGTESEYDFTAESQPSSNVKLLDEKGNTLGETKLNANNTFLITTRKLSGYKGETDITGVIASSGNPVNGATIYVKTPQGVLIQKTSSDKDGNYFFRKLPSSSMMLEVDTSDLRIKFKTNIELNGTISSNESGKKLAGAEIIAGDGTGLKLEIQTTDKNGNFSFKIDLDKVYAGIENSKNNPWDNITAGVNHEIVINTIYFDYDKWNITFDSERELDKVFKFLKENSAASLNIKAHTDARGGDEYNLILSRKRAKSVMNYFNEHGIDTMRLMSFGYGETQLINKCDNQSSCSDALHKKNRRIEFEISWNGTSHNNRAASPMITNTTTQNNTTIVDKNQNSSQTNSNNTTSQAETGRWYKVQISTSGKLITCTKENFKGLENVEYYIDNGIYKYTVGKFATKEEAISYRKNVIDLFPQAFPVILENGVRVK